MDQGVQKFVITLDNQDKSFSPGDLICGKIIVDVSRTESIRGLKLIVKGEAEVGWTRPMGASGQVTSYLDKEEYFSRVFYLLGGVDNSENVEMQTGELEFLFNFSLPRNIPSSFEHKNGRVAYTLIAVLERPWKFDHQIDLTLKVETPFDFSRYPPALNVIDDEEYKTFCYFPCFKLGSMKIHVHVPTSGFTVGETIEARIDISNDSTRVEVTKVELQLQQIVMVIGHSTVNEFVKMSDQGHAKKSKSIIQTTEQLPPFERNAEITMGVKVPPVPSSNLVHCSIINVLYRLNVRISLSYCQGTMEKSYPIVIGTKPTSTAPLINEASTNSAANSDPP